MCEGKQIRRRTWGKNEWIGLQGFNMNPHIAQRDFLEDDWEVYDEDNFPILLIEAWEHARSIPEFEKALAWAIKNASPKE